MPEPRPTANSSIPPTLGHVIGQPQAAQKLQVAVEAAFADGDPLCHTLLTGPAGTGKSMLAQVLAAEMQGEFHERLAQTLATPGAVNGLLMAAESDKAILFIDEIHELPSECQTTLYTALDQRAIYVGHQRTNTLTRLQTTAFTLIGATTDPQMLLPPLRDRFKLVCQLQRYGVEDLVKVVSQKARQLGWEVDEAALPSIAERSFGTPRLALRLLESAYRTARSEGASALTQAHVNRTFFLEGIDSLGLGPDERLYLRMLADASGPLRLAVIASRLGQPPEAVSRVVETNLLFLGLIERTDRGRMLTPKGIEHARLTVRR